MKRVFLGCCGRASEDIESETSSPSAVTLKSIRDLSISSSSSNSSDEKSSDPQSSFFPFEEIELQDKKSQIEPDESPRVYAMLHRSDEHSLRSSYGKNNPGVFLKVAEKGNFATTEKMQLPRQRARSGSMSALYSTSDNENSLLNNANHRRARSASFRLDNKSKKNIVGENDTEGDTVPLCKGKRARFKRSLSFTMKRRNDNKKEEAAENQNQKKKRRFRFRRSKRAKEIEGASFSSAEEEEEKVIATNTGEELTCWLKQTHASEMRYMKWESVSMESPTKPYRLLFTSVTLLRDLDKDNRKGSQWEWCRWNRKRGIVEFGNGHNLSFVCEERLVPRCK